MTFSRRYAVLLATVLATLFASRAQADEPDACSEDQLQKAFTDIARARAGVTTLVVPFTQERSIGLLAAKVRSTGTLTLVRPDRLRWELAPPDSVTYWITPEGTAYKNANVAGRAPPMTRKAAAAAQDLRTLLAGDLGSLQSRYIVRGKCPRSGPPSFELTPKTATAPTFNDIRLTLAPDLIAPATVTVFEAERDRTDFTFGTAQVNVPVKPETMVPSAY